MVPAHPTKIDLYNSQGERSGTIELPSQVFGVRWNAALVHQVLVTQLANQRKPIAHSKTRGEVRGGGKKPWRQKHTGRSRHGSNRSPLWVGGGVTFGPRKERFFGKRINKKMARLALYAVLSKKLSEKQISVLDSFALPGSKTKLLAALLRRVIVSPGSVLLVMREKQNELARAAHNLQGVRAVALSSLSLYDCLAHRNLVFEKGALEALARETHNVSL